LKRVALAFDEGSDSGAIINEVNNWLSTQSETSGDLSMYRPLQTALDALCKQQSGLNVADDLATLQAVENSLRMQLQEERRAMTELNEKLQMDLKNARDDLQAERDRFLAEIWIEKEASAVVQQELRDGLRDAAANIHILRGENARLRSLVQEFETSYRFKANPSVGQGITHDRLIYNQSHPPAVEIPPSDNLRPFHAARSAVELSGTAQPSLPSTQQPGSQPMPYGNLGSRSMDNIRDRRPKKAKANASSAALATNRKSSHHPGIPQQPYDKSKLSVGADGNRGLQGGRDALTGQPQYPFLTSEPQYFKYDKSTTTPVPPRVSKPRRILKMASSPLLRKNEDRNPQTSKRSPPTDALARRQAAQPVRLQKSRAPNDMVCIAPWESHTSMLDSSGAKGTKKPMRHWWPHGWKLFDSGDD
jgi:hypothetical protein